MVTAIFAPQKPVSFEKADATIYATAQEACNAAANEIGSLKKFKQRNGRTMVLGLATGSNPKKV